MGQDKNKQHNMNTYGGPELITTGKVKKERQRMEDGGWKMEDEETKRQRPVLAVVGGTGNSRAATNGSRQKP